MTREHAIDALYDIGKMFADEMGLKDMSVYDTDCGIWDDKEITGINLSELLRKEYGEMKTVCFHDSKKSSDGRMNLSVEVGFRFGDPKLCVFGRNEIGQQTLASMELSDYEPDGNGGYHHTGEYKFRESQVWGMEGLWTLGRLIGLWTQKGGK